MLGLVQLSMDLGGHLDQLLPLDLEGIRVKSTEEGFSIRMQLCPGREDERRCI